MLFSVNKKSLFTFYFSFLRPCLVFAQTNMSSGIVDADKYSTAFVTVPNMEVGRTIGHGLVENKLAACVNVVPQVTSIYKWEGKINEDSEVLLMIKTRTSQVDKLTEYVRTNHPYKVCEVISLPIKNGNPQYLDWIGETVPEK
ncbi:protein CutA homolog [Helicoverpa armigera]|uniref:protein CutA homolog n=1 Tax=Helicoverpa armigera TaxID=29058 RepID=UPI003083CE89